MRYFKFAKLIRDKIIDHMKSNNQTPFGLRVLNESDYIRELSKKIVEEAQELNNAADIEELKEELADVQEIVDCLKKALNISNEDLKKYQEKKKAKNGGFDAKIYLDYVGIEDDNKWLKYYVKNPDKYPEIKD